MEQARTQPHIRKKPSFTALVRERFLSEFDRSIEWFERVEKVKVLHPVLSEVIVTSVSEDRLYFDALYDCAIQKDGIVSCKTLLIDAFCSMNDDFASAETRSVLTVSREYRPKAILPDSLVPVISKKELDTIALKLICLLYPRAREYAVPVSPDTAAKRLGLKVIDGDFGPSSDLLGKIYFEDARATVRDFSNGTPRIVPVTKGTVLVNTCPNGTYDGHIRSSTILHECVHWLLHRPAYTLAKLWDPKYRSTACRRRSATVPVSWSDEDRMEWQAGALASRLLMPAWSTRFIAEIWLKRYDRLPPILKMERTIDRLSLHFNVSRQLAKIRMTELGYRDADAAFSYYETRKHQISFENIARELARNPAFSDSLRSGAYAYVENCLVVLDSKNVFRDEAGTLRLTPFAKAHMDECCLSFAARRSYHASGSGMERRSPEDETFLPGSKASPAELALKTRAVTQILQSLPTSFSETLVAHMKRKGITTEQLAEKSLISVRQLYRFKSPLFPSISLPNVVGLCVGLSLHPLLALDLVRKAGYSFNLSAEHSAYETIVLTMTGYSIYECNEYLVKMKIKPIGREE